MTDKTLPDVKEQVRKEEPSMNELISIEDVNQDVNSWENVDKDKLLDGIAMDAWTYGINHPYGDTIRELAVKHFVDDMRRMPKDHSNPDKFETIADMAIEGYWPYTTSREEITEIVRENIENIEFMYEYEDEIRQEIESAIIDARLDF
jgi:hypothetical protein